MSAIAMRKSIVVAMTAIQRRLLRIVCERIELSDPFEYTTPGNVRWYVCDDPSFTLRDMAILGRFAAAMANAPDVNTRAELVAWIADTIVWPRQVDIESDNPWQAVLTANGAPAWLQAAGSVPATLTPVES